jgi:hypothetical protein
MTLGWMTPIRFQVEEVVEQVDRGGASTECDEGNEQGNDLFQANCLVGKGERHNEKNVLDPLMRAQGFESGLESKRGLTGDFNRLAQLLQRTWSGFPTSSLLFCRRCSQLFGDGRSGHFGTSFSGAGGIYESGHAARPLWSIGQESKACVPRLLDLSFQHRTRRDPADTRL